MQEWIGFFAGICVGFMFGICAGAAMMATEADKLYSEKQEVAEELNLMKQLLKKKFIED